MKSTATPPPATDTDAGGAAPADPATSGAAVDDYIRSFPPPVQAALQAVRRAARQAAPLAEERISYRMPTLFQQGVLLHYGAFQKHIGLFPPVADPLRRERAARYAGPKGNLQLPLDEPMPQARITAIVRSRLRTRTTGPAPRRRQARGEP